MSVISKKALAVVLPQFKLDAKSNIHGAPHWVRVAHAGKLLAGSVDVNPAITEWFAYLHDARRQNDHSDPLHGYRAGDMANDLRRTRVISELNDQEFEWLLQALDGHSGGQTTGPHAVLACWDADRLDLGRVGIKPDPARMCTALGWLMARDLQKQVVRRR